jgi:hypothetical protein
MKRLSMLLAVGVALALALAACGRSADRSDPYAKLLAHTNKMIEILKDNRADPDKAIKELAAYQEEHKAELNELKQDLADFMQKDPMKAAAVSAVYGLKSAELDSLTAEMTSRARAR